MPADAKFRWYVVQTQSNYEKRVQSLIREQRLLQGMQNLIEEILIPVEKVTEIKKGQKVDTDRKFFPGYVLVKCVMSDDVWHLIKSIPHITSFIGAEHGRKPLPISNKEAENILRQMSEGVDTPTSGIVFEVGENVRVIDGPFNSFQGTVDMVEDDKQRLRVSVSIFGRATPIDLEYKQVEKV
ncbi:MAG: transcription termination/antitermination protein NusG [Alphaproteobacteria bacterium]